MIHTPSGINAEIYRNTEENLHNQAQEVSKSCNMEDEQGLVRQGILEECEATLSRILAWRIPWTEEPGGLQSIGSQRVRHD